MLIVLTPQSAHDERAVLTVPVFAQLVATLVAEIILCCKEVNTKTRAAAFELLVEIGHAMQAACSPLAIMPSAGDAMGVPTS